jgi:hypothetical protein
MSKPTIDPKAMNRHHPKAMKDSAIYAVIQRDRVLLLSRGTGKLFTSYPLHIIRTK